MSSKIQNFSKNLNSLKIFTTNRKLPKNQSKKATLKTKFFLSLETKEAKFTFAFVCFGYSLKIERFAWMRSIVRLREGLVPVI
jgi:hypothetical protein